MGKVFISYAHEDEGKAFKIKARLEELGFTTWIDQSAPASRDDVSTVIDAQIDQVASVLVLWSKDSLKSVWVRGEALRGLEGDKYFGILLDPLVPPVPFNAMVAPDLSDWTGLSKHLGWDALVRGLASTSEEAGRILASHVERQAQETIEADRAVATQIDLPLEEPEEVVAESGRDDGDIDNLIAAAQEILSGSNRHNLSTLVTQLALDQEMLRDAAFVVSPHNKVARPHGANFRLVSSLATAARDAVDGDLIVIAPGTYTDCVRITKRVRIVGLGLGAERPTLVASSERPVVSLCDGVRLENVSIETRHKHYAVHCEAGRPSILRCDIRRFSKQRDIYDGAFYVAGKCHPIVIASSVAATGCSAAYFAAGSGGQFLGVSLIAVRGDAVNCRGRPTFRACNVEAVGGAAVRAMNAGRPSFEECELSGRGDRAVVLATNQAYPRIKQSRVNAVRQLAFDFEGEASGRYEGNIVAVEVDEAAGTGRQASNGFFGLLRSKQDSIVASSKRSPEFARLRGQGRPVFIANMTPNGEELRGPLAS
ncbi:MAG: TIR domain-containing protein [Hyphomonadaceae bacterium]|nr:TIR domain-containing protein [Hyphomonadaceae bacterium]